MVFGRSNMILFVDPEPEVVQRLEHQLVGPFSKLCLTPDKAVLNFSTKLPYVSNPMSVVEIE